MAGRRLPVINRQKLGKNKSSKTSVSDKIYCHLCKHHFKNQAVFRLHIMQKHRPTSQYYEGEDSESDSEQEEEAKIESDVQNNENSNAEDSDESNGIADFDQNLYNISETAVSPHSCTTPSKSKGKKNSFKFIQNKFEQPEGNKAAEQVDQSSPQLNHQAGNVIPPLVNSAVNYQPQIVFANNQLQYPNFFAQQPPLNDYLGCNQPVLQYQPVARQEGEFVFKAKNIIKWYNEFKKINKGMKLPMRPRQLKKIKVVIDTIYNNINIVGVNMDAEKHSILTVYSELCHIISRNFQLIGEKL